MIKVTKLFLFRALNDINVDKIEIINAIITRNIDVKKLIPNTLEITPNSTLKTSLSNICKKIIVVKDKTDNKRATKSGSNKKEAMVVFSEYPHDLMMPKTFIESFVIDNEKI